MKTGIERELKLEAEDGVDLDRLGGDPLESHVFSSVYHDTDDLRLLRAGLTLRRRMENGASTWQLKISRRNHAGNARRRSSPLPRSSRTSSESIRTPSSRSDDCTTSPVSPTTTAPSSRVA